MRCLWSKYFYAPHRVAFENRAFGFGERTPKIYQESNLYWGEAEMSDCVRIRVRGFPLGTERYKKVAMPKTLHFRAG
ncbi:hypothetical protein E2562_020594 [Oryza meyeriana var. granulata]|uniref:Uncharacterized protein n=1 Tax=Oryza meyeriana var. granulata TaxID=110450 RepID=A0A6G1DYI8_9ORYZ|nr:hypothetical protein E2562_020594 [Oryza meyeriana var. granulata]